MGPGARSRAKTGVLERVLQFHDAGQELSTANILIGNPMSWKLSSV